MHKLYLQDLDLKGKKVLLRVDFNVPLDKNGAISDDTRLRESLPSIQHILDSGGSVILMSHLGRPKRKGFEPHLSLAPCAKKLSELLGKNVLMAKDCVGEQVEKIVRELQPGQILLLENLRFHPAEEKPSIDPNFAKKLASYADLYINDAFGAAHREHSSIVEITKYFPGKAAAGHLLQKEIRFLSNLLTKPKRPFYAIIGGAKISTKMGVLKSLLSKVDGLFIGGGMSFTFFKALGISIGNSIFEKDQTPIAETFLKECTKSNIACRLPTDLVIADAFDENAHEKNISAAEGIPDGWQGMDIGKQTIADWIQALQGAGTVFWNGPLGVFEFPKFAKGTKKIAQALTELQAITIVGGGDSVAAINQLGIASRFTHISTGGGASMEFIEFGHLPGIDALSNKN